MLRAKSSQRHCTEEQLLAFLDRELRPEERRRAEDHLSRCWQCRARMGDLESSAHDLAQLLSDATFLGPSRVAAAKEKFLAAVAQPRPSGEMGQSFSRLCRLEFRSARGFQPAWFAAGMAAAACIAWFAYTSYRPDPIRSVSGAVRVESSLLRGPVHQRFSIQFLEDRPQPAQFASQLEIWSDPVHHRFASRWNKRDSAAAPGSPGASIAERRRRELPAMNEHNAALPYAVWQPDSSHRFRYDQGRAVSLAVPETQSQSPSPLYSFATASPGSLETLEAQFSAWISTRVWQPLTIARDFSLFVNREGMLLRTETRFANGHRLLALTARSSEEGAQTITITLELDPVTHKTTAQEIILESSERKLRLRVVPELMDAIPEAELRLSVFTPDVPRAEIAPPAANTEAAPAPVFHPPAPKPGDAETANTAVKIEYELHRLNACTGEAIEVSIQPGEGIRVTGAVTDPERRDQLAQALQLLQLPFWVKVDIQTIQEMAAGQAGRNALMPSSQEDAVAVHRNVVYQSLPLDEYLNGYFSRGTVTPALAEAIRSAKPPGTPQEWTAAYSSRIVSLSQKSYRESWAIKRLAGSFPNTALLNAESTWLLEAMLRDHARQMGQDIDALQELLQPVFASTADLSPATVPTLTARAPEPPADAVRPVFDRADPLNRRLFEVFASGVVETDPAAGRPPDPKQVVSAVLSRLPELQTAIRAVETLNLDQKTKARINSEIERAKN